MFVRRCMMFVASATFALLIVQPAAAQTTTVTGTVSYQQRSALPDNTVVTVRLVDVSRADAPATLIAEQQIPANGKSSPIPFTITFDPARIDARNTYVVQATIATYGQDVFRSTSRYPVLTQGQPTNVDIVVSPIANQLPNTSGAALLPVVAAILLLGAGLLAFGRQRFGVAR